MASEIKVDTIVNAGGDNDTGIDLATNDQILLKVANATKLTMNSTGQTTIVGEGGTNTTSLQSGLAKAWMEFNGTGTIAINDSLNFSSIVDETVGNYQVIFATNMGNSTYTIMAHDLGYGNGWSDTDGTSGFDMRRRNEDKAYLDVSAIWTLVHGDLA